MTIEGTVNKTARLFLLVGTGYLTFNPISPAIIFTCGIGGFILAIVTVFETVGSNYSPYLCHFRGTPWRYLIYV